MRNDAKVSLMQLGLCGLMVVILALFVVEEWSLFLYICFGIIILALGGCALLVVYKSKKAAQKDEEEKLARQKEMAEIAEGKLGGKGKKKK